MRLASARALKEELLAHTRRVFVEDRLFSVRGFGAMHRDVRRPVAAFGVAPLRRRREFAVAVRVFSGNEKVIAPVLTRLQRVEAQGELDLAVGLEYKPRSTIAAGTSCGHYRITAGTLGGFVEDTDYFHILSNNHVLANSDVASVNDPILQPGPADIRGGKYSVIGSLHRWVPLTSAGTVDAAIAKIEVDYFYPWFYEGIGAIQTEPVNDRYQVLEVSKKGRTTGVTHGRVSAFELDGIALNYGTARRPKIVTFDDQIEFVGNPDPRIPFSKPGDSGSFILDSRTLRPYALLYGGGPDFNGVDRTLGQFMPDVLNSLGVWLVQ